MSASLRQVKTGSETLKFKKILKDEKKRIRFYFLVSGIVLLALGFSFSRPTVTQVPPPANGEVKSFSQEPVRVDKALVGRKVNQQKDPPVRITIPEISIDIPVKVAKVVSGYWEVFPDSAGFGLGSAYPDEVGNQVIFAHARKGLFLPLKGAKVGQQVIVFTKDKWYSYTIREIKEVLPSNIEVIAPTNDSTLTLYTCTGFDDSKRLIVVAKKT